MKVASCLGVAVLAMAALPGPAVHAATTQVIYSFAGGDDGQYTDTDLVMDAAGDLYGTSVQGGDFGGGTVWELSPSGQGWTHTVLYSFTGGADGAEPYKGVTLNAQGNLLGAAVTGGSGNCEGGCGVVYKLTNSGGSWTQTVIHAFTGGADGAGPDAGLTLDQSGDVYGMTPGGGADGAGTIFRMHQGASGNWELKVIHAFTGGADGNGGSAGRLVLQGGKIYGTATSGGIFGEGAVYQLTPAGTGRWRFKALHEFADQPDGGFPYGGLTLDAAGNLYGTTYYAGANDFGTVYRLSPAQKGKWTETTLYSFKGGRDGASSIGNLVFEPVGNLFGTTSGGGAGKGVIFRLTPRSRDKWRESVVHIFHGAPDGAFAYSGMISDGAGNYYGATTHGGTEDEGAVYRFTP